MTTTIASAAALLMVTLSGLSVASTYSVIVPGLGGSAEYQERFDEAALRYSEALGSLNTDPSMTLLLDASADRQTILQAIEYQAQRMRDAISNESSTPLTFALLLVGHGNADREGWRFNITGPDVTTQDLIAALNAVPVERQLVVLAASASGAALDTLSQLGRVLITATKSGGEINAVRFPDYFADALHGDQADYDRNEILTTAEAFRYALARTEDYYETENLLASEHARLRGELADDIAVALLGSLQEAKDDPVVTALLDERLVLEQQFKLLRERRNDMPVNDYYAELEPLLIAIARLQVSIDAATGWSDSDADS